MVKLNLHVLYSDLTMYEPFSFTGLLYCTVLYCTVLYCTVLYCTVLYCTVLYSTVLYCTVLYCTVLYCTLLYCTVLYCTVLYSTVLYYSTAIIISKNFHILSSFNVKEMWELFILYLNIVLSWPEDGRLRPKHVAKYNLLVIIASCLDVCCVLTVHNTLYKYVIIHCLIWP